MAKIRIVIEYDPDWTPECIADPSEVKLALDAEKDDWLQGRVDINDIIAAGGKVEFETIP